MPLFRVKIEDVFYFVDAPNEDDAKWAARHEHWQRKMDKITVQEVEQVKVIKVDTEEKQVTTDTVATPLEHANLTGATNLAGDIKIEPKPGEKK